jgi:diacylglycerol kinase
MLRKKISGFGYALKGLAIGIKEESSFQIQIALGVIAILFGLYFQISVIEWLFVFGMIGFVLTAELFNTALEELCDMLRSTHDPHVAKIKDLAAGAVLLASVTALIVGASIFLPYIVA